MKRILKLLKSIYSGKRQVTDYKSEVFPYKKRVNYEIIPDKSRPGNFRTYFSFLKNSYAFEAYLPGLNTTVSAECDGTIDHFVETVRKARRDLEKALSPGNKKVRIVLKPVRHNETYRTEGEAYQIREELSEHAFNRFSRKLTR